MSTHKTNGDGPDGTDRGRSPIRFLSVAWITTITVLAIFMIGAMDSYRRFERTADRTSELQILRGRIILLDEVLTMSAKMSAATGDAEWETRYRRFEPQLGAAIDAAMQFIPDDGSAAQTDQANATLIDLESRAFDLVRDERSSEAAALLASPEYVDAKAIYATGMERLGERLDAAADEALGAQRSRTLGLLIAGGVALGLLALGWMVVLRLVSRWQPAAARV